MEAPVEIRYAGVLVGRAQEVRAVDNDDAQFFLFMRDPLPVGTAVQLRSGERETPARVVKAIEASDPAQSGMQIRFEGDAEVSASRWIPAPPSDKDPPPRPVSREKPSPLDTPVVEILTTPTAPAKPAPVAQPVEAAPAEPAPVEAPPAEAPPAEVQPAEAAPAEAVPAEVQPAEAAPAEPAPAPADTAVPEAVPVAVGSSMTDALKNATGSTTGPTSTDAIPVATESAGFSTGTNDDTPPPAKPVASASGRRRTKKRR